MRGLAPRELSRATDGSACAHLAEVACSAGHHTSFAARTSKLPTAPRLDPPPPPPRRVSSGPLAPTASPSRFWTPEVRKKVAGRTRVLRDLHALLDGAPEGLFAAWRVARSGSFELGRKAGAGVEMGRARGRCCAGGWTPLQSSADARPDSASCGTRCEMQVARFTTEHRSSAAGDWPEKLRSPCFGPCWRKSILCS